MVQIQFVPGTFRICRETGGDRDFRAPAKLLCLLDERGGKLEITEDVVSGAMAEADAMAQMIQQANADHRFGTTYTLWKSGTGCPFIPELAEKLRREPLLQLR